VDHGEWTSTPPPLEVVNLLRSARSEQLWKGTLTCDRVERIARLAADCVWPEDDRIAASRRVVHKYAYDTFAEENAALGWAGLVPEPHDHDNVPGPESLDGPWETQASPVERTLILRALDAAV
jgi:hypothetical protein